MDDQNKKSSGSKQRPSSGRGKTGFPVGPRTKKSTKKKKKGLSSNSRFIALILSVVALVVILFVVLIACGLFDSEELKAQKAAKREAAVETVAEEETTTAAEEVTTQEPTTEAPTVDPDARTVYFTFDTGPSAVTEDILDVLDAHKIKGTFFILAEESDAAIVDQIAERGHAVGVYSASENPDEVYAGIDSFKNDVNACRQFIFQNTGSLTDIYRFPGGSINASYLVPLEECKDYLKELGMVYYDWNVDSGDDYMETVDAQEIANNILNGIHAYEFHTNVVLLHDADTKTTTADALEIVIPQLEEEGFEFAGLSAKTPEMTFDIE